MSQYYNRYKQFTINGENITVPFLGLPSKPSDKKVIYKESISRKDYSLPDKGFIFTCFNSNKKISEKEFDIWMRLLRKTKESVLWLKGSNKLAINNLRTEAEKRNVDKNRLIFANSLPLDQHLARHSLASLGLDTFAFNGCSTSTFGLWAGMPILTKLGESFSARFTASLLNTMGVHELITHSKDEYEEVALRLANKPDELLELKDKIKRSRYTSPLFNSKLFTNEIEEVYKELINKKCVYAFTRFNEMFFGKTKCLIQKSSLDILFK